MDNNKKILPALIKTEEEKHFAARLIDKIKIAERTRQIQATDFIDPHLQELSNRLMKEYPGIKWTHIGGSKQAERRRVLISPESIEEIVTTEYIALLNCEAQCAVKEYIAAKITHRDYLGAVLSTGIRREKLGDIWLSETGCVIAAAREIAGYLYRQPLIVKGISFEMSETEQENFEAEGIDGKIVTTTVPSMRLDAVAAAGFGTSRSKLTREILAGRFKVNWQEVTRLDYQLDEQDVISCRGRGRVIIDSVGGQSKKGRFKITLKRLN